MQIQYHQSLFALIECIGFIERYALHMDYSDYKHLFRK